MPDNDMGRYNEPFFGISVRRTNLAKLDQRGQALNASMPVSAIMGQHELDVILPVPGYLFGIKCMKRRCPRPCINLGLDQRNVKIRKSDPFTPTKNMPPRHQGIGMGFE